MTYDRPSPDECLPPGWWWSDRGPVSPSGVLFDVVPSAYEPADLEYLEAVYVELGILTGDRSVT